MSDTKEQSCSTLVDQNPIQAIAEAIEIRINAPKGRGKPLSSITLLKNVPPQTIAQVACKTICGRYVEVDRSWETYDDPLKMTVLATSIGENLEKAAQTRKFLDHLFRIEDNHELSGHQLIGTLQGMQDTPNFPELRSKFSKVVLQQYPAWKQWSVEDHLRVGVLVLEIIIGVSDVLEHCPPDSSSHIESPEASHRIYANPTIQSWYKELRYVEDASSDMELEAVLTTQPPLDWLELYGGGYPSNLDGRMPAIKATPEYLNLLHEVDLSVVYNALNKLQRTPWRINQRLLDVMNHAWQKDLRIGGLPPAVYEDSECKTILTDSLIQAAVRLREHQQFYYVHQIDFRGRIYPVTGGAPSPQGSDVSKALIEFADGKPLDTQEALNWFYIHGANLYGYDKVSFEDRIRWVQDNHADIIKAATHPIDSPFWHTQPNGKSTDKPWQFLAWCMEYKDYQDEGKKFLSHCVVRMDATCSALQIYALMLKDTEAAEAVNVKAVDSGERQDMYQRVADEVTRKIEKIEQTTTYKGTLKRCEMWRTVGWDRSACKGICLVYSMGGSRRRSGDCIEDWYEKHIEALEIDDPFTGGQKRALQWFGRIVWEATEEVNKAGCKAMTFLKLMARHSLRHGQAPQWTLPTGLVVKQPYHESDTKRVKCRFLGKVIKLNLQETTSKLDASKQRTAFAPNFEHSWEAALLTFVLNNLKKEMSLSSIHDCYATHAHDAHYLARVIREQAAELFTTHDPLRELREEISKHTKSEPKRKQPSKGDLDPSCVLDSPYFVC